MPWWLFIKSASPHVRRLFGVQPQLDKNHRDNYDKDFHTKEHLSGNQNLILGHQFGGSLSKQSDDVKNKTYYDGELDPAYVYGNDSVYGGEIRPSVITADKPYYGGELPASIIYGNEPVYDGGELPGANIIENRTSYYGGELPGSIVYGYRSRKRNGSL